MDEKVIVELCNKRSEETCDVEIPLNITAIELLQALNKAMNLGIRTDNIAECYLTSENPIALLRGDIELSEFGLHDGSKIFY